MPSSSSSLENNTARGFERVVVSKPSLRVVSLSLLRRCEQSFDV